MRNPFKLLWYMLRFRNPKRVEEMRVVADGFWLRKGYAAMTFFGYIVVATKKEAEQLNATTSEKDSLKRHEMIHLKQAQSTHNSWFLFYVRYIWYYVRAIPQNKYMRNAAYYLNPFEMEAYEHMYEKDYLEKCKDGANGWRVYAKMKPKERRALTKR